MENPRVYIAGPDLFFRKTWPAHCAAVTALCADLGLTPVFPVPPVPLAGPGITAEARPEDARPIYQACLKEVAECDAILANLSPFRGSEPDSGTVWEAATGKALGKIVVGYTTDPDPIPTTPPFTRTASDGAWVDNAHPDAEKAAAIERFQLPMNLMPACGVDRVLSFADGPDPLRQALQTLRDLLQHTTPRFCSRHSRYQAIPEALYTDAQSAQSQMGGRRRILVWMRESDFCAESGPHTRAAWARTDHEPLTEDQIYFGSTLPLANEGDIRAVWIDPAEDPA